MGVRLPAEYQEVEYIECDGNEYIDTGYYVKSENVRIIISCFTASSYYEYDFIGNQDGSTGRFVFGSIDIGFFLYTRDSIGSETNLTYQSDYVQRYYLFDATYNLEAGIKSLSVNGITASNSHTRSVISKHSVQVFADGAGAYRRPSGKYYHVALYDAGALAFDLIPCYRKSDNKTGMYDLVSGGFFTSQGTGEFLVGPDVIDSISPWLIARRRMLMQDVEYWTYVLTEKYAAGSDKLNPMLVPIVAGQTVVIAWGGCSSFGLTPRLWTLKDGATFNETTKTDQVTKYIGTDGQEIYTVKTSGNLVLAGLNVTGTVSAYLYSGDYVKARIT